MRIPQNPPKTEDVSLTQSDFLKSSPTDAGGRYLPWDELRRKSPTPHGWTHAQWWVLTDLSRNLVSEQVPEMFAHYPGNPRFFLTSALRRQLFELDRNPSNKLMLELVGDPETLNEYRIRELLEEAIDSSMIEGARPTTRDAARQMLREGRTAASRDERMIANNWRAMQWLLELRKEDRRLDVAGLLELHRILGEGALECERVAGEFRGLKDDVSVMDLEGVVWHQPPPREGLEERVAAMLRFAQPRPDDRFVHPVVRAILVHFWLGYEHPFCDGNGRMARALYYWVMLRNGYEIAEFLSISGAIRQRGNEYYKAFAYCEAEELDLTYFLIDQLASIEIALSNLIARLRSRKRQLKAARELLPEMDELNHRQRTLLESAIRHPLRSYTITGHATAHGVHYLTARTDLANLEQRGLLTLRKVKKENRYRLAEKLHNTRLQ